MTVAVDTLSEVKSAIERSLKVPAEKIDIYEDFSAFGLDSIVAMEFIRVLSEKINYKLSPVVLSSVSSPVELANYLNDLLSSQGSKVSEIKAGVKKNDTSSAQDKLLTKPQRTDSPSMLKPRGGIKNAPNIDRAINLISKKYGIDLSVYRFKAIDDIVDVLIADYSGQLSKHFQFPDMRSSLDEFENPLNRPSISSSESGNISIVGIACRLPDANNYHEFWNNLISKKVSLCEVNSLQNFSDRENGKISDAKSKGYWGAKIDNVKQFDRQFFGIEESDAHLMDPQERLLLEEVYNALQDACLSVGDLAGSNTGVFVGHEYSEYEQALRNYPTVAENLPPFTSSTTSFYLANRISHTFEFCGPSETFNVNCVSSSLAINRAVQSLRYGECDLAIVCGVSLNLFDEDYAALTKRGLLSPTGTCGVFDEYADGYTRGEGVAVIVLTQADAGAETLFNRRVYANIKSACERNRGSSQQISEIKHEAITDVICQGYQKNGVDPESVSYIEVNGYATKWGDAFEFEGIKNIFDKKMKYNKTCALGSLKGNIGHLEPANGIVSVIKVALSLFYKKFPPTITTKTESSFVDFSSDSHPLYIGDSELPFENIRVRKKRIRAGVNSFADSGVNVHILLEEVFDKSANRNLDYVGTANIFLLSAKTKECLARYIDLFLGFLESSESANLDLKNVNYTLQCGREHMPKRLAILPSSFDDLKEKLEIAKSRYIKQENKLTNDGIIFGCTEQRESVEKFITRDIVDFKIESAKKSRNWKEVTAYWANGIDMDWKSFWLGKAVNFVSLPNYPFRKHECWANLYSCQVESPQVSIKEDSSEDMTVKNEKLSSNSYKEFKPSKENKEQEYLLLLVTRFLVGLVSSTVETDCKHISENDNFMLLGLSSLNIVNVIQNINSLFEIRISPVVVFENNDIAKISSHLISNYLEAVKAKSDFLSANLYDNIDLPRNEANKNNTGVSMPIINSDFSKVVDFNSTLAVVEDVLWRENTFEQEYEKSEF